MTAGRMLQITAARGILNSFLRKKSEEIHRKWIVEQKGNKNNLATEGELQRKYDWLKAEIIRIQQKNNETRR